MRGKVLSALVALGTMLNMGDLDWVSWGNLEDGERCEQKHRRGPGECGMGNKCDLN